eukprot:scaffold17373_cov116-Isochrysis_galbana.AAC.3
MGRRREKPNNDSVLYCLKAKPRPNVKLGQGDHTGEGAEWAAHVQGHRIPKDRLAEPDGFRQQQGGHSDCNTAKLHHGRRVNAHRVVASGQAGETAGAGECKKDRKLLSQINYNLRLTLLGPATRPALQPARHAVRAHDRA